MIAYQSIFPTLKIISGSALVLFLWAMINTGSAQDSETLSSGEIIEQLQDSGGMSFRGLVIVPPEEPENVSTDAQGNTVVTDDKGNIFITDDIGITIITDTKGNTIVIDVDGTTVITDTQGNTIVEDEDGNTVVTDVQGNVTIVAPPSIDMKVAFQFNSDELTEEAVNVLNNLGVALTSEQLGNARFMIAGHTDASGSRSYNQKLSERRANSVRDYLVRQFDIHYSRLDAVGRGEEQLLFPDDPENGGNRRVQIVNIGS